MDLRVMAIECVKGMWCIFINNINKWSWLKASVQRERD